MLHRQSDGTGNVLQTRLHGNERVAKGDAFEIIEVCGHHVEQIVVAGTVKNNLSITGGLDNDWPLLGTARREVVRAIVGGVATLCVMLEQLMSVTIAVVFIDP